MPPCGAGVARSRGRGRPGGARETRSKTGHAESGITVKIQSGTTTTFISVLYTEHENWHCCRTTWIILLCVFIKHMVCVAIPSRYCHSIDIVHHNILCTVSIDVHCRPPYRMMCLDSHCRPQKIVQAIYPSIVIAGGNSFHRGSSADCCRNNTLGKGIYR